MAEPDPSTGAPTGPVLLCAGNDAAVAASLAAVAALLLAEAPFVVVAARAQPGHGEEAVSAAVEALARGGVQASSCVRPEERVPWQEILALADDLDARAIVAGTTDGASAHAGALGREARALAHRSRRPLLLVAPGAAPAGPGAPAVFAYDGSEHAGHALRCAVELLRARPATVVNAWTTAAGALGAALVAIPAEVARAGAERLDEEASEEAAREASAGAHIVAAAGWSCAPAAQKAAANVPTAVIAAAADRDAALIVTGTRGRSRVAAALLGSTAEAIARHADRPVLLVPPADRD